MAIIKSSKKAIKRSAKLAARNAVVKTAMNSRIRSLRQAVAEGKKISDKQLSEVYSVIDKAAKINIIHPKNAWRKKSRLTLMVNSA